MITSFTTSRENAAKTDATPTIRDSGKYVCTIIEADTYERHSDRGDFQLVRLMLESTPDKQRATVEFIVSGGKSDWSKNCFDALCVCAGAENPVFSQANIKAHRRGIFDQETTPGFRSRTLEGKKVGVVLQKVIRDYRGNDGQMHESYDMQVYKSFNADTELTASEIVAGATEPKKLARAVASLKDRDLRTAQQTPAPAASAAGMEAADYNPFN